MLLAHDRTARRSWFSGVLLFVRDTPSKSLTVSTAAAQERPTIPFSAHPFSNPVAPNKPSNSAASADGGPLTRLISTGRPHHIPFYRRGGEFLRKISGLRATSGGSGVAENVILRHCRAQARFTRHFNRLAQMLVVGSCTHHHPFSRLVDCHHHQKAVRPNWSGKVGCPRWRTIKTLWVNCMD